MPEIVLTADRTLIARYRVLLDGILGTVGTSFIPRFVYETFISPKAEVAKNGQVAAPPYGLRKIEAALLENGQQPDGSILLPEELVPYMNGLEKISL